MDISMDYNGRDILVATRDGVGTGTNNISILQTPGFGGWKIQDTDNGVAANGFIGDIIDANFSTTYNGDSTIVAVYTSVAPEPVGTFLTFGDHDLSSNDTTWEVGYEVLKPGGTPTNQRGSARSSPQTSSSPPISRARAPACAGFTFLSMPSPEAVHYPTPASSASMTASSTV
jgi:hypothetical protein